MAFNKIIQHQLRVDPCEIARKQIECLIFSACPHEELNDSILCNIIKISKNEFHLGSSHTIQSCMKLLQAVTLQIAEI